MKNLMGKAKDAHSKGDHKEALRNLLRLDELKMDLIWEFETGKAISSLCVAKNINAWEKETQIIVGSEDNTVYSLSLSRDLLWKFTAGDEITSVMPFDFTKDFSDEIIVGSKDTNLYVLNTKGDLLWEYRIGKRLNCVTATDVKGKNIIIAGSLEGTIHFIEFKNGTFWEYTHETPRSITGLCIAKLMQDDGKKELIAVTDNGDILVLNYQDMSLKWRSHLEGSLYGVLAKDIDNDGSDEIIVCSENAQVYCLDAMCRLKWQYHTRDSVYSVHCCDIDNNNDFEILLGTRDNYVYVLDSQGNFKWRYRTDHNVWSIFSDQISHSKFYDLFAGLSNSRVYYYKLIDRKNSYIKIEKSYLQLLNSMENELKLLEDLSQESDEYFRKFSIENITKLANEERLRPFIFKIFERLLGDNSPIVRIASIRSLFKLIDYEPEVIYTLLTEKFFNEDNEDVRKSLIENITKDYLRTIKQTRKTELLDTLHILNEKWKKRDYISRNDLFDLAKEKFFTGNYKEALKDFELLYKRGLDLKWKIKTKGFICSLVVSDIDGDGFAEIMFTSSKNVLYVTDHTGQLRWYTGDIPGFRNNIKAEDIDADGKPEIILGCTLGSFLFFTPTGEKKGEILLNEQINCFSLLDSAESLTKDIVYGCTNGYLHCIDISGREKWSFRTGSRILKIAVDDIDNDGFQEIIAGTFHGHLFIIDPKGKEKWRWKAQDDIETIVTTSAMDHPLPLIIIGTRDGHVYALDSKREARLIKDLKIPISEINIEDINGDGKKEIVIATHSNSIYYLNSLGQEKTYDLNFTSNINCFICSDINNDGCSEFIIGSEDDNIYLFKALNPQVVAKFIDESKEKLLKIENKVNFYRKNVFRFINDTLEADYMSSKKILLLGYLGTGKSELLWEVNSGCLGERYIPVYISLQYFRWRDTASFLYRLSKEILNEICNRKEINYISYKKEFEKDYRKAFDSFVKEIKECVQLQNILILFDDFERLQQEIIRGNLNKEVFDFLEKLSNTKRCSFIITASNKTFELEKEYEGLFLSDAVISNVNFINKFDAKLGLTDHLTNQIENVPDVVDNIIKITGCQAHFLQVALDAVVKYVKGTKIKRLTKREWKGINAHILESIDNELLSIWDNCSPHEKLLLSCISKLTEKFSIDSDIIPSIKSELGVFSAFFSENILNDILTDLSEKSILDQIFTEDEIKYTFTIPLMKDWIRETKEIFEIIHKNSLHLLNNLSFNQYSEIDHQLKEQDKLEFFLSTINFDKRRWDILIKFSQAWNEIQKGISEDINDDIEENINKLYNDVKNFAVLFDFSIVETVDHPRMTYFKFKTPSITLKKLKDLLVLIIPKYEVLDESFYDSLTGLIIDQDAASNMFLILEFVDSPRFKRCCEESKLDLVLMNQKDLKGILLSKNYLHTLIEHVILRQVDLVQFSPYVTMAPVEGKMFFGRLPEIRKIECQSDKCFAVVGARQLGKTSLLLKVRSSIMENRRNKTLYVDCETYDEPLRLCSDILKGLSFSRTRIKDFNEFRSIIIEKCKKEEVKLSIFLDEIDDILEKDRDNGELLFKSFRSLYQEGYITLVIAGYETLFVATKDIKSPLFNFLEVIRLGSLSYESAAQLIIEPMNDLGIEINNKKMVVDEICKITACYPNLIQCMCKRIVEMVASEKRKRISEVDIARVKDDREFEDYVVRSFYNPVSEMGKIIILLLINAEEFGFYDIDIKLKGAGILLSHRELNNEIDNLCMLSILTRQDKQFRFTLPYLSTIFKETMEIDLELDKLIKEVKSHDH